MHPFLRRVATAFALCLVSSAAAHAQARIEDCEKIQAADAYNQCLAKFGPPAKVKSVEPLKPGDIKGSSDEAAASAMKGGGPRASRHAARGRHGHRVAAHAAGGKRSAKKSTGGRKRMTITVKRRK